MVPFFLLAMLIANAWLLGKPFYLFTGVAQIVFYASALLALYEIRVLRDSLLGKIAMYFTVVNSAILVAWIQFLAGTRLKSGNRRSVNRIYTFIVFAMLKHLPQRQDSDPAEFATRVS